MSPSPRSDRPSFLEILEHVLIAGAILLSMVGAILATPFALVGLVRRLHAA